jgi:plasmid maintenance system antidote protein VapI
MLTKRAVLKMLRARVALAGGSVSAAARALNVPQQTLAAVLVEQRSIGPQIAKRLKLRRVVRYEKCTPRSRN